MDKYKALIGIEMHCEISKTNTKVFSSARNAFTDKSNIYVNQIDMAFPGMLPVVNKEAVKKALMASIILNCKQPEYMYFERKNYYYPDLPKGYQITQETKPAPVGIYGNLIYECNGEEKTAVIDNIHLEEDTVEMTHYDSYSTMNYNRAGVPLLELVTGPCFHSADEVVAFLETMRSIYQYANISEADSKKGQIRCDVNVSIMDIDKDETDPSNWGTKIEVKGVNSFSAVKDTINYEIERQIALKESGEYDLMEQQTRRWDEESGTTIFMRVKVDAIDYKYFVEPNIPKFKISSEWIEQIKSEIPSLARERKQKYISQYGLSVKDANILVREKAVSDYFDEAIKCGADLQNACNWITTRLLGYLNKECISIEEVYLTPSMLTELLEMIDKKEISSKQGKDVFYFCLEEEKSPKQVVEEKGMKQNSDDTEIRQIIIEILNNNSENVEKYKSGKTNLLGYFVGLVMKETKGQANPSMTSKLLIEELNNR